MKASRERFHCPECDHHWVEHDLYGCQKYLCKCKRIDRDHRFVSREVGAVLVTHDT